MKEWVTTDYYVDGYYYDTTWTDGYNNRNEWLKKAHNIAHGEAIKHKVEFRPYDGHGICAFSIEVPEREIQLYLLEYGMETAVLRLFNLRFPGKKWRFSGFCL